MDNLDSILFPEIEPYHSGYLPVSDLHTLYYEEVGNPDGRPVIFLHGGPGGGISTMSRRFFDPSFYRVILFDQRGAGQSTPHAELRANTTWDLVADIEAIRRMLDIERWLVFGGSWGSTLALAYAVSHPERVTGLVLRGIYLMRQSELDWLYRDGASHIFPEGWQIFNAPIPQAERDDLLAAYHRRLTSDDPAVRQAAARQWCRWETQTARIVPDPKALEKEDLLKDLAMSRIETHYMVNNGFFESDTWLLEQARSINHIPTIIVQGRYDCVCPITSAWELKQSMPSADLRIMPKSGHSVKDTEMAAGVIRAVEDFKGIG